MSYTSNAVRSTIFKTAAVDYKRWLLEHEDDVDDAEFWDARETAVVGTRSHKFGGASFGTVRRRTRAKASKNSRPLWTKSVLSLC